MDHQGFIKFIPSLLLHFLFTLFLCHLSCADPPYNRCLNTNKSTLQSPFQKNLQSLLQSLSSNASSSMFYNTSNGNGRDKVYALYMCLDYVTKEACRYCVIAASQDIEKLCFNSTEAVVYEEFCLLRYSNKNFFGKLNVSENIPLGNLRRSLDPKNLRSVMNETLLKLAYMSSYDSSDMYAIIEVPFKDNPVYALMQCTRDLSPDDCNKCLGIATQEILDAYSFSIGARLLSRSCYLRYELYPFYEGEAESSSGFSAKNKKIQDSRSNKWKFTLAVVVSTCFLIAVFAFCVYYYALNNRFRRRNNEIQQRTSHENLTGADPKTQEFSYAYILSATNNFSDSNKLGQGGFGPVYKGVLRDGREVAIKRLSICSEQGSEEFTNEVQLIMKLQHKNLVKLLGFCVDGEEKLLVYEYMPNSSLDPFLFDHRKRRQVDWKTRMKIIGGIARGTLYLHEDSRLRIIHRDLKASNILLDWDMNPKISDFGTARIFAGTEGQANTTRIVGTYGYMDPEYALEGIYSVKSDVFSFGVLLLEIITGKRNAGFYQTKRAWHLWREGRVLELMDPLLVDSCDPDEFLRYLHIGLLCVQEDSYDRPTMSSVVVMLKSKSTIPCQPKPPAPSNGRFTDLSKLGVDNNCSVNGLTVSDIMPR